MTKEENISLLKQKFYEATATPEEERRLAQLLRTGECPEIREDERRALLALLPNEEEALPEGFGLRLARRLERERIAAERPAKRVLSAWWPAAAAVIVLLGGATLRFFRHTSADKPVIAQHTAKSATPAAPKPVTAKTEEEVEKEVPTVTQPPRRPRHRRKTPAAPPATQPPQPTPPPTEEHPVPPQPPPHSAAEPSLAEHLQRTQQSRDRLIAEARDYMSGSCLNRNISPSEHSGN